MIHVGCASLCVGVYFEIQLLEGACNSEQHIGIKGITLGVGVLRPCISTLPVLSDMSGIGEVLFYLFIALTFVL